MTELKLVRGAAGWLRQLGLTIGAISIALGLSLWAFNAANSNTDPGWNSEIDYAMVFEGSQYAGAASPTGGRAGASSLLVESWVLVSQTASQAVIFEKNHSYNVRLAGDYWVLTAGNGTSWPSGSEVQSTVKVQLNSWTHVALLVTSNAQRLFINGREIETRSVAHGDGTSQFTVGAYSDGGWPLRGQIDEVRIWHNKNEAFIAASMHARPSLSDADLKAHFDFNEPEDANGRTIFNRVSDNPDLVMPANRTPKRMDVKVVSSVAGGETVVTFPRTYMSGLGGWTAPANAANTRVLMVAGGGAGGRGFSGGYEGGGGGAGGFIEAPVSLNQTSYPIVVGQGGLDSNGQNSSGFSLTALGGGKGASDNQTGSVGGSGGGGTHPSTAGGSGTSGQGFSGGTPTANGRGGGGGGALEAGDTDGPGHGGDGRESTISGQTVVYAGGGAAYPSTNGGGLGGGANAATALGSTSINGTPNTGGGGAGAYSSNGGLGGLGGSGVVIVRYTPTEDMAWNKSVAIDQSFAFLSTSSNPVIPVSPSAAWTFEAWIRPTSFPAGWNSLWAQQDDVDAPSSRSAIWMSSSEVVLVTPSGNTPTNVLLPTGRWFHLAWVMSTGTSSQLYLDGALAWSGNLVSRTGNAGTHFALGGSRQTGHPSFNGQLDQVKVWGTNLTQVQVSTSMHAYSTWSAAPANSCTTGLRAHYDFNEFVTGMVVDRSSCGRHLAFNGNSGSYAQTDITSSAIVSAASASAGRSSLRFFRSYLTATGGWTPPAQVNRFRVLVVGGGGGGSRGSCSVYWGAGAGGGQVLERDNLTLTPGPIPISVGQGGARSRANCQDTTTASASGQVGQASSLSGLVALGGQPSTNASRNGGASGNGQPGGTATVGGSLPGAGGGGAGGPGGVGDLRNGGASRVSSILGAPLRFGAGGPGKDNAAYGSYDGNVAFVNAREHWDPNSGGGGADWTNGASGVVILSWGPYLEVTRSPIAARVGSAFTQSIQIQLTNLDGTRFSSTSPVTVTSSAALIINGVPLTQSLTVNAVDGVATFTGLGFAGSVNSAQTLTFTSDAFVGTSLTITPTFFANNLVINNSNASTGFMLGGEFFASSSAGVSFLNVSDLHANAVANTISISVSGSISVSSNIDVSISGRAVTLRAGADIQISAALTTMGPLNLFSDSDGSGSGSINTDAVSQIRSFGNRIFISGGLDPTTGYAMGSRNSQWSGVRILGDIDSEGGDIVIRGDSGANVTTADVTSPNWTAGVMLGSKTVDSGAGSISISAAVNRHSDNSEVHYGVTIGTNDASANGVLRSSIGGISIRIDSSPSTGTNKEGLGLMRANVLSDTGTITISAIASGAAYEIDVDTTRASRISTSGSITLEGRGAGAEYLGALVLSSPSQISIRGDRPEINSGFVITSSPEVVIESFGSSFSSAVSTTNLTIGSATRGLRIGKTTNIGDVTLGSSLTLNGPLEVNARDISVANLPNVVITSESARITLRATRDIDIDSGSSDTARANLQSRNGDIILWVNSANSGTGYLHLGNFTVLNSANGTVSKTGSGGGRITLGGGSSTDSAGHPTGGIPGRSVTSRFEGLWVAPSVKIYSGGGDVSIAVAHTISGYQAAAFRAGSLVWSGTGRILVSVSHTVNSGTSKAIELSNTSWISAASASPAIEVTARVSNNSHALYNATGQSFTMASLASSGGGVSVSALTPSAANTSHFIYGWNIESRAGRIDFYTNGVSDWNSDQARAFGAGGASEISSSSADIFVTTQALPDSTANSLSKISTSGLVSFQPAGATFTAATRLRFDIEAGDFLVGTSSAVANYTSTFNLDRPVTVSRTARIYAGDVTVNSGATVRSLASNGVVEIGSKGTSTLNSTLRSDGVVNVIGSGLAFTAASITGSAAVVLESYGLAFGSAVSTANLSLGSSVVSFRVGRETNTSAVTLGNAATVSGPISAFGGTVTVADGVSLVSSSTSARILLKSSGAVELSNGTSASVRPMLRTSNGDIILWADSDGDATGKIYLGTHAFVDSSGGRTGSALSGGGRITLAGSYGNSGTDSAGHPLGSISLGAVNDYAMVLQSNSRVFSGGGDITIRVNSGANYDAFHHNGASEINAGTGEVLIEAISRNSQRGYVNQGATVISAATLSPAIEISARTNGTNVPAILQTDGTNMAIIATGQVAVGISISAITGATAGNGVILYHNFDFLSAFGDISIYTNGYFNVANDNNRNFGAKASSAVLSSSADISIVNSYWVDTVGNSISKISTSGDVSIRPFAANFLEWIDFRFDVESGDFTFGNPSGVTTATKYIFLVNSITASGSIVVAANDIYVHNNQDLVSTGQGESVRLISRDRIEVRDGSSATNFSRIQTNGGPITFWSDADGDGVGSVRIENYVLVNTVNGDESEARTTGGGRITIGGGLDSNLDGFPDGFVGTTSGLDRAVQIEWYVRMYAGGGDISIRGRSASNYGVVLHQHNKFFGGQIRMEGEGATRGLLFVDTDFGVDNSGPLAIVSHATASPAIFISGKTSGTAEGLRLYGRSSGNLITIASTATSGGGVELVGESASTSTTDFYMLRASVLSRFGTITVSAEINQLNLDNSTLEGENRFGSVAGNGYVSTSSATINLVADEFDFDGITSTFRTSGDVNILPRTSNFFSAGPTFAFSTDGIRNLTIGKDPLPGNTERDITITGNHTVSGNVSIFGGSVFPNGRIASTGDGTIRLKAMSNVLTPSNARYTTQGGDFTVWADSDNNGSGTARFGDSNTVLTNGGDITIAGGLDDGGVNSGISGRVSGDGYPDGFATDTTNTAFRAGVELRSGRNFQTSGGNVFIAARGGGNAGDRYGMFSAGGTTDVGSGVIEIWARMRAGQTTGDYNYAWFAAYDTAQGWSYTTGGRDSWISSAPNKVGIDINVDTSNATGQFSSALNASLAVATSFEPAFRLAATGENGGVRIRAIGGTNNAVRADGMGAPVLLRYAEVLARSGEILIESTISATAPLHPGVSLADTPTDNPNATWMSSDRFYLGASPVAGSPVTSSSANITIRTNSIEFNDGGTVRRTVFSTSGTVVLEPLAASFRSELTTRGLDARVTNLRIGKSSNTSSILVPSGHQLTVSGTATFIGGSFSNTVTVSGGVGVDIQTDDVSLSAAVQSFNGFVHFAPRSANRSIDIGTNTAGRLGLVASELSFVDANRLRLGSGTSGDILLTSNISLSAAKVGSLRLTTQGSVTASTGAILIAPNLAIDAGGGVNLPGSNSVSGAVAISASSMVTYSSAVSYSPGVVDGVTPVFGVGKAISLTNSPTTEQANEFLAVTFNPPPQVQITDHYNKVLDGNNRTAYTYTVSASVASGSGVVQGLTSSSRVGGLVTFNALRVNSGVGVYAFTFSAEISPSSTLTVRSADYNVMAGEPGALSVSPVVTTSVVGQTGLQFTVTVRDAFGNAITAGEHKNITVSASVSGATLVSGTQTRSSDAGVATFNSLVLSGSTSNTITVSFAVTFNRLSDGQATTVTSSGTLVTLTPGAPSQLVIDSTSQTQLNRSTLSQVAVRMLDSFGNQTVSQSGSINAVIGSGSGATLVGSSSSAFASGATTPAAITFSNLALQGTVGTYRIDFNFSGAGVSSVSHTVTLTPGAATRLSLDTSASGARAGLIFTQQPRLSLRDIDNNLVPVNASISATSVTTLTGTTLSEIVDGYATFSNLAFESNASAKTLSYRVTAPAQFTSFSTSQSIVLNAGVPFKLVWGSNASNQIAGTAQAATRVIVIQDQWNNATSQSSTISVQVRRVSGTDSDQVIATQATYTVSPFATSVSLTANDSVVQKVGSYRFRAVSSGLVDALSTVFAITNASAHKLAVIQDVPSTIGSRVSISPTVQLEVRDQYDNPVIDKNLSLSATVISGSALSILGNQAALVSGSSIVEFPDLAIEALASNLRLRYSITTIYTTVSISSQVFAVSYGQGSQLSVSATAVTVENRKALPQLTVSVLDSAGNLVANSTANVNATVTGPTLDGTKSVFASSGLASFSALTISGTVGTYDLSFTANGLTSATTSVTLTHGAAASIELTVSATAKNAQTLATQPVVRILDADGNLVTTGTQSTQTVELIVSPGALTGTTQISASAGVATFSGISLLGTAGSHTLTGRIYLPSQLSDNETITLGFGNATKLTLETNGAGAASGIALTAQPVLTLRDSSNNIVTGVAHNVVATITPSASTSGTTVAVNTSTGTATFTALSISGTVGAYSISFSVEGASSSDVASVSQDIQLTHGVATSVRVVSQPTSGNAGVTLSPLVVEVIDARGNRITTGSTASKTVTITNAKPFTTVFGTKAISLSAGVATFDNISLDVADNQYFRYEVAGIPGANTAMFLVSGGAPAKLGFTCGPVVDRTAGSSQANDLCVRVYDRFGNFATLTADISVSVEAVLASDTSSVSKTISNTTVSPGVGFATIAKSSLALTKAGVFRFKVNGSNLESGLSGTVTITNSTVNKLVIVQDVPSTVQSGLTFSPAVRLQVQDAYGNPVVNATYSASVSRVAGTISSIVGGVASSPSGSSFIDFPDLALNATNGTARIRFTANFGSPFTIDSSTFTVASGAAFRLSVSATTQTVANRVALNDVVVRVLDSSGNLVSGSTAQVSAGMAGATLSGTAILYSANGIASFSGLVVSGQVGTYNLSLTSTGLVGATVSVTVTHGAANRVELVVPSATKNARTSSAITATIFDADGNRVTTGAQSTQTVTLTSSGASISGTVAISASAGIATFSNVALTGEVGTKSISATILLPTPITQSQDIELTFGDAFRLDLTTNAAGFVNRVAFDTAPVITVRDVSDNVVPTSGMDIRVTVATASISGSITASAATGVASFASNLTLRGLVGIHTLTFTAEGTSSSGVATTTQVVSLTHGAASQLVLVRPSANALSGAQFATQPTFKVLDPEGNLVTTGAGAVSSIEATVSGNGFANGTGDANLTGTVAISASAGLATFSDLVLTGRVASYTVSYKISGTNMSTSETVALAAGAATDFRFIQIPTNVVAGETFSPAVSAEIIDAQGNRVLTAGNGVSVNVVWAVNGSGAYATNTGYVPAQGLLNLSDISISSAATYAIRLEMSGQSALSGVASTTSPTFVVSPAVVSQIEITSGTNPVFGLNNQIFGTQPNFIFKDRFGNQASNAGNITVSASVVSANSGDVIRVISPTVQSGGGAGAAFTGLGLEAKVGSYVISFSAELNGTVFASVASAPIEVRHGVATQIAITRNSADVLSGIDFATQPRIELRDSAGNRVSTSAQATTDLTVSYAGSDWTSTQQGVDLSGTQVISFSAGIATFTDLRLSGKVGSYNLKYTSAINSNISVSEVVVVEPGNATKISQLQGPQDVIAGEQFANALRVQILDAYDNRVTRLTSSTTVVAKLISSASNVLETSAEFGAQGGVVTFSGLVFTTSGEVSVRYEVGTNSSVSPLTSTSSATFKITHAAPDSIQWLYLPVSTIQNDFVIAGVGASRPQLIAKDRFGNVVDTGTVKISVSSIVGTPQSLTGGQVDGVSGSATIQSLKLRATVGSYTLRFAASTQANSNVFSSISHVIEVTPGVADQLSVNAGHPTSARANMALSPQPEISILDSAQNLVSSSAGVINISVQGAQHAGQTSLAATSGVAAFTNVKLAGSASSVVTLSYALQGTDISTSKTLTLAAGAAVKFDLDWTTANIQTRAAINPAPKLILRDADGNVVLSDASTQGVAKLMRYGSVVTESDLVTAASGEINFAGLTYIATPGGGYSLKFEAAGLPAVTTSEFVVLPGPVSQVQIFIQPSTSAVATALTRTGESLATQPKIRLLDVDGNLVTTVNSGTVTAAIASGAGGQLLTASATIVEGVATFTELGLIGRVETPTQSAEIYTLQFGYGGFSSSPSLGISVMHNVATQISVLTEAAGGRSGLLFTTKPQVVTLDRYGNRVFQDPALNIVAAPAVTSGSGNPGVVNDDQGVRDSAGVYTFDMGISGRVANTYSLTFYKDGGGITSAVQSGITITHGNAFQLGFLTLPSSTDSNQVRSKTGENLKVQPVIEVQDASGNRVLNSSQTITATFESTVRGARDFLRGHTVSAVSGVATFTNLRMIADPASTYRLNFAYNQNQFTAPVQLQVTHADAEYLTIATAPDGGNKTGASLSRSPIITVHDFDGNLTTSLNGASVSALIASGGGSVVADGNEKALVQGGIAQFSNLKIVALPGVDQRLYFNLDGYNNSASATVTSTWSNPIQVTFSDAYKLSVFTQPCTGANCGIGETAGLLSTQPVVEVQDFYGNRVTDFVGSITATAQGTDGHLRDANARISSVDAVVVDGLATFSTLRLEGRPNIDYRLSFAVGSLVSTTSNVIQVKNTVADYLAITTQPVGGVTGAVLATQPVIEVRDRFDNVVVDYSGSIQASVVSGPNRVGNAAPVVSGSATATVVNGVATFNSLRLIGLVNRDYVLGFSDGTRNVSSSNVRLSAASAATVELVNVPAAFRTGDPLTTQPVLRVLDFDGNLAVSTSVTITAGVASGGGYIESGTVSSAVSGGYVTFSNLVLVAPVGVNQQLSFTASTADGSFNVNTTTALTVRHTDIAYFQVQTPYVSGNYQQGAVLPVQPKLFGFDRYGNKAIYDNSTVVTAGIGSGSGGAVSGSATATVTAGEVQFAGLAVTGSPGVSYKLNFSANLVTGAYSLLNPDAHTVFKTAAIQLAYPLTVFSLSATVSPTVALTDSNEHAPVYSTTTPQFCSVNSSTGVITMLGAGSCVIRSTVANGTYYRSNTLDVTLPIAKADQAPLVLQNANNVNFGSVLALQATGGSSTAPIEFATIGRCVILGDKLMPIGNATEGAPACTLLVLREGDANFNEATVLRVPITVNRIAQAPLSIGNSRDTTVGDVQLFTVGGSGAGTVSYTVVSNTNTVCTVLGNTLSSTGNGTCEISAQKAQDQNYNTASSTAVVFTFSKQVQQLSFTSLPPSMPLPGQVYQASATVSSGLTISFSITMGQGSAQTSQSAAVPAVCSLVPGSNGQVQFLRSGNCEITATQAGNGAFAEVTATLRINVGSLNQFITFPVIEDSVFGAPALRLNAEASSDLPVSYTVSAGITACTVTNGMVNFLAAGNCEIVASQAGDSSYAAAPPKSRAFRIIPDKASAPSLVSSAVGNQWFTLRYTQPSYAGGSNILGYRLEVLDQSSNSAGVYVNTACTTLTCTMAGIPNDRPYVARIAAITAAGVGQFSQYSRTMTPTAAQMGVTELAADVSSAGLDLNWIKPAAIEGNFSRYEVFVWVTGSTEPQTASAVLTSSNSSTISVPISSISSGVQIAPAISNRVAVIQPAMNITNRLFIFGAQATRPVGFVSLASVQSQTTASATVGYSMKVVTITDTFSSSMTINTANGLKIGLETPAAPTQLGLDTSDPTKILVTWAAPLSDGGFAIEDYKVVVNGQTVCANIQTRVCEISPLNVSTTYNVEVMARNALGFGTAAVASHTTPTPPPPVVTDTRTTEAIVRIPQLVSFTPKFARAGELVEVSGRKINSIIALKLGDVDVNFTAVNDSTLRFRVPVDTKPGTYDIQHFSEFGKVSVIDALIVLAASSTVSPQPETQSPVTPITESPVTQSPTDPTDPVDPTDPGQSGGSGSNGSGGTGSGGTGSNGGNSEGGSSGGSGENNSGGGEAEPGESEPGTDTESSNAGVDEPTMPAQQNPLWWILLIALFIAGFSYWALRRERE